MPRPKTAVTDPSDGSPRYSEYREIEAAGARVALMTCLICGAAIVIDPGDPVPATTIHNRWHQMMANVRRDFAGDGAPEVTKIGEKT